LIFEKLEASITSASMQVLKQELSYYGGDEDPSPDDNPPLQEADRRTLLRNKVLAFSYAVVQSLATGLSVLWDRPTPVSICFGVSAILVIIALAHSYWMMLGVARRKRNVQLGMFFLLAISQVPNLIASIVLNPYLTMHHRDMDVITCLMNSLGMLLLFIMALRIGLSRGGDRLSFNKTWCDNSKIV
jgi:hypothetical protein